MIIDLTKKYVPESYVDSRDYRVFLRQLGLESTVFKYNIDHLPDLYSPYECPDHMLPLLASMVGYNYKETKSIDSNRKIIKNFPYMIRNRGSRLGIKMAVVLSINTDPNSNKNYSISKIIVDADIDSGLIKIYYPNVKVIDWDLIEVVRPVGMRFELIPVDVADLNDELSIIDRVHVVRRSQYFDESIVNESQVGFDTVRKTRYHDEQEKGHNHLREDPDPV